MDYRMVISEQPVDLDVEPVPLLDLVALSPDANLLFAGLTYADPDTPEFYESREIVAIDSASGEVIGRMTTSMAINGVGLAAGPDNRSVFATHNAFQPDSSITTQAIILHLSLGQSAQRFAAQSNEEILRLITGPAPFDTP